MKYFVIILISFFIAANSYGESYSSFGLSTAYISENNPNYKIKHELKSTITFSHFVEVKPLTIGYSTNRIDNWLNGYKDNDIIYNNGIKGIISQKITTDTILIGKKLNRYRLLPMIFFTNAKIDNKYYMNNNYLDRRINHTWLYGININYFLNKKVSGSFSYIFPNDEVHLENGFIVGINYNF